MSENENPNIEKKIEEGILDLFRLEMLPESEKKEVEDYLTTSASARSKLREEKDMDAFIANSLKTASVPMLEDRIIHNLGRVKGRGWKGFGLQRIAASAAAVFVLIATGEVFENENTRTGLSFFMMIILMILLRLTAPDYLNFIFLFCLS